MQDKGSTLSIKFYVLGSMGIKGSLQELRNRCRQSEGFYRLLKLAAARYIRGESVEYVSNNRRAERALKIAVAGIARAEHIPHIGNGPFKTIYQRRGERGVWHEIPKAAADELRRQTTADSIAVREVIVYSSKISRKHAALLERKTRPQVVSHRPEWSEYRENREEKEPSHGNLFEVTAYDEYGNLETMTERAERQTRERKARGDTRKRAERMPSFEDAFKHMSTYLTKTPEAKAAPRIIELPAAPWYHAAFSKRSAEQQAEIEAGYRRKIELEQDAAEVAQLAELDEFLAEEDLEYGMVSPAQALAAAGY